MMGFTAFLLMAVTVDGQIASDGDTVVRQCFATIVAVEAGQSLDRASVVATDCTEPDPSHLLHYDPVSGRVVARQSLAAQTPLGHVWLPDIRTVRRGDVAYIHVSVGPIQLTRTVVALQDASVGESFFVQDASGEIFRAPPLQATDQHQ